VGARRQAVIADPHNALDLLQGQPRYLAALDEFKATEGLVSVVTIAVGRTFSRREQAPVLIEPDRLGCHADSGSGFTDSHFGSSSRSENAANPSIVLEGFASASQTIRARCRLDLPPWWKVNDGLRPNTSVPLLARYPREGGQENRTEKGMIMSVKAKGRERPGLVLAAGALLSSLGAVTALLVCCWVPVLAGAAGFLTAAGPMAGNIWIIAAGALATAVLLMRPPGTPAANGAGSKA